MKHIFVDSINKKDKNFNVKLIKKKEFVNCYLNKIKICNFLCTIQRIKF